MTEGATLLRMTGKGATPQANWGQGNHFLARFQRRAVFGGCGQRPRTFGLFKQNHGFAFLYSAIADIGVAI